MPLFDRSPQGVEPTLYGRALFKRSLAIFDELRRSVQEIEFLADPAAGELRIGSNETATGGLVSAAIDRLSRRHPRLVFHLEVGTMPTLQFHFPVPPSRQRDERGRIDRATIQRNPRTTISAQAPAQLSIRNRMYEDRHAESGCGGERGSRLRRIEKESFFAACTKTPRRSNSRTARVSSRAPASPLRVHGRKAVKAVGVATHQLGQVIVYPDDGVPRGVPVGILDEFKRRVHHASRDACYLIDGEAPESCEIAVDCIEVCAACRGRTGADDRRRCRTYEVIVEVDDPERRELRGGRLRKRWRCRSAGHNSGKPRSQAL